MDCQPCGSLTSSGDMDGRRRGYFCITDKLYVRRKRKKLYVSLLMVHKLSYQKKNNTSKISLPHRESIFFCCKPPTILVSSCKPGG